MRGATERAGSELGVGRVVRAVVGAWMRGWTAFVAATGEPYLSLAGRQGPGRVAEAGRVWEGAEPEVEGAVRRRSA